ncbi:hypothetical protein CPB86DRAFT_485183 [Serendipita vermifera]|nr:hypothetical protein CPB86DRAFT_485183 [Serendipita vermifera]
MCLSPYLNPFDRELVPGRQLNIERRILKSLRKRQLIEHRFSLTLPFEIWGIILWYLLEPTISPHTYCNSDTYPTLHLYFYRIPHPDYQDWFRCRQVCRTWKQILGPYPHLTFSAKDRDMDNGDIKGITSMYCRPYNSFVEFTIDLHRHQQLLRQITVLSFDYYSGWSPGSYDMYPHDFIDFANVRCLSICAWNIGSDWTDFWPSISRGFPRLVSLSVQGVVYCSGEMSLPHLEILGFHPTRGPDGKEPHYSLPKLRHISLYGAFYPKQLLADHGPSLHSLLPHSSHQSYDLTPAFWSHFASLRTVGICPRSDQVITPPPPDHPLRHLSIFVASGERRRVKVIKDILVNFPLIRDLSVRVNDIRGREKRVLLGIARKSSVSIHFLPQPPPFRRRGSRLELLFRRIVNIRILGWRLGTIIFIPLIIPFILPFMTVDRISGNRRFNMTIGYIYLLVTSLILCAIWYLGIYHALHWTLGRIIHYIITHVPYLVH